MKSLTWPVIAGPLAAAEDALARLDERSRSSPIRSGWIARSHFSETVAAMNLAGELVSLEDLVLHDAAMDVRAPPDRRCAVRLGAVADRQTDAIGAWRSSISRTAALPPVLAAALALLTWDAMASAQTQPWLGLSLSAAHLRERGKTSAHLACLATGLKATPFERRRSRNQETRLLAIIDAFAKAAEIGLRTHDRWLLARQQLEQTLVGRRSNSSLPALIELVMAHPIVTAELIASRLNITQRAALGLIGELNIRETTGRMRYRA